MVPSSLPQSNCSDLVIVRTGQHLDPRYLAYYLNSAASHHIASVLVGAVQQHFNVSEAKRLKLPIPPIDEQRRIVQILGCLDEKIELNRQTAITLEELAQRLFKSWFVDFDPVRAKMAGRQPAHMPSETAALFPEKLVDSPLGRIPNGWGVKPVLEVCDLRGGAQPPASTFIAEPKLGYVRLLQIRDFSSDSHPTFVPEKKNLKMVTEDDILIGRYGSASGNKGKDSLGRMCRGLAGAYNVALMKLEPKLAGREFSYQIFNSNQFYWYLHGISSKAVQSGFSKKELAQYKVVIPTGDVMQKFEMLAAVFWEKQKLLMRENQTLIELRNRLLPKLIGGKIRVSEAQEIAEEA